MVRFNKKLDRKLVIMKNRRIRFDDRLYNTIFSFLMSLCSLIIFILYINDIPTWGIIILTATFSLFLSGIFVFPKIGIYFNYKLKKIKYFGQYKIKNSSINMDEITKIDFISIDVPRKKGVAPKTYIIYDQHNCIKCVYRNGKIYMFYFHLTNGEIIEIPYLDLFKAFSKKRVEKQEKRIGNIINEFNNYIKNKIL